MKMTNIYVTKKPVVKKAKPQWHIIYLNLPKTSKIAYISTIEMISSSLLKSKAKKRKNKITTLKKILMKSMHNCLRTLI